MDQPTTTQDQRPGQRSRNPMRNTFASMAYRDFVYLWLGQVTHAFALWIDMIAQPLLILGLTDGSAVHLGLVLVARMVPSVVLGPVAGAVADSFNRRLVLLSTKVSVLLFTAIFTTFVFSDWSVLWPVYTYSVFRGITMAFDQPARRAMVPSIVPRHLVTNAMALTTGSMAVTRIVGAGGAGLLVSFVGYGGAYLVVTLMYVGAVFFTWVMRIPDHDRQGYQGIKGMGSDLVEGFRFAWSVPAIRGVFMISLVYFAFGLAFMQVFAPLFATEVLGIGERGFGFMMSTAAVGGTVGALLLATVNPSHNRGNLVVAMLTLFGVMLIAFSASTYLDSVVLTFAVIAVLGMVQSNFHPVINAVLVEAAPEHMRGRVVGLSSLDRAFTTLGAAVAGFLSAIIGAQQAQIIFGLACVVTAIAMYVSYPAIRRID